MVASYHTDLPRYTRHYAIGWLEPGVWTAMRALHNSCDLTLCPSRAVANDLREHGFQRLRYWSRGVELAAAYASADLFVFPSDSEAFGNVILEAMASGLPVVAAAAGGVLDLVESERTGLLFEPDDAVQLARQVGRYLRDPQLRQQHGEAGLAAARARTWPNQQRLLLGHYASALDSAGPRVA